MTFYDCTYLNLYMVDRQDMLRRSILIRAIYASKKAFHQQSLLDMIPYNTYQEIKKDRIFCHF